MRFTLQRQTAMTAISAVQQAVQSGGSIPILKNILLNAADGILEITATNGDIQVKHSIPDVRIERDGAVTVSADKFKDSVGSLADGADFMFEFDPAGGTDKRVTLRSGRARFTMVTLPATDFPLLEEDSGAAGFTLDAGTMSRLLTIGVSCAAQDKNRSYLNGVYIHEAPDGRLRMVSTDTKRLAWADKRAVEGIAGWGGVILSTSTVDVVTRLLRNEDPNVMVSMDAGHSRVMFGIGRSTVITKVIGGRFVPYERVVPTNVTATLTGDTDLLIGALNRALVMMDSDSQRITLRFEDGGLTFETRTDNMGEVTDSVGVDYQGPELRLNVNGGFLKDLLGRIRTENTVFQIQLDPHVITVNETGESDMFAFLAPQRG